MKIAILYICTGIYNQFFEVFYDSCEKFFLKGKAQITYFVWTDDKCLSKKKNVVITERKCQGFPFDSLFRFEMFTEKSEELSVFDYIYFFNSNTEFILPIGDEILPDKSGLVGAEWLHKNRFLNFSFFYPYERNIKSKAYIEPNRPPYIYYMGGINGGVANKYLEMIHVLKDNIRIDFNNGIIAYVHDESHINKYFRDHPCKLLEKGYCKPEEWRSKTEVHIIFRNKAKINSYFNKNRDNSIKGKIKKIITMITHCAEWYIRR